MIPMVTLKGLPTRLSWPMMCPCCGAPVKQGSFAVMEVGYKTGWEATSPNFLRNNFLVPHCRDCGGHCNEFYRQPFLSKKAPPLPGMSEGCAAWGLSVEMSSDEGSKRREPSVIVRFARRDYADAFRVANASVVLEANDGFLSGSHTLRAARLTAPDAPAAVFTPEQQRVRKRAEVLGWLMVPVFLGLLVWFLR